MIRLEIIGTNYGRTVQLPAFRADPRCEVVALAESDPARAAEVAKGAEVPKAYGDWRALVEDGGGVIGNFICHCFHYLEWFCGARHHAQVRSSNMSASMRD